MKNTALASATIIAITTGAFADVVVSSYSSSTNYEFELEHMPDFDQVRDTLAVDSNGDPGGMYCVPTAITNLYGYATTHGFTGLGPIVGDWEAEEEYDAVTGVISCMASWSGTTGTGGTYHEPAYLATMNYVNTFAPGQLTVTENLATNTSGPTLRSIVDNNVNGAITALCYGIYDDIGDDWWGRKVLSRTGGHCVSFVRGWRSGSDQEIKYMDPDDNSNSSTQSNFGAEDYDVESVNFVSQSSTYWASFSGDRTGSRIMRTSGGKYRVIDSVIHIRPRSGYSWDSSNQSWVVIWPMFMHWVEIPSPIPGPFGSRPKSFTPGPFGGRMWSVFEENPNIVYSTHMTTQERTTVQLPHAASKIAFARDHALMVLGDSRLTRLNPYDAASTENAPQPYTVEIPAGYNLMAIDDAHDAIWLAGGQHRTLQMQSVKLDTGPINMGLPQNWPSQVDVVGIMASDQPEWTLGILGSDGRIQLCKVGSDDQLHTVAEIWTDGTIHGLQANDEGDVLTFSDSGMKMYRAEDNIWREVTDHPFVNRSFGPDSVMSTSRTNFNILEHGGDQWRQIRDPEPVAGDTDGNGIVNIDDLLNLLSNFGNQGGSGDLNGNGWVDVDDMLILLSNWTV